MDETGPEGPFRQLELRTLTRSEGQHCLPLAGVSSGDKIAKDAEIAASTALRPSTLWRWRPSPLSQQDADLVDEPGALEREARRAGEVDSEPALE